MASHSNSISAPARRTFLAGAMALSAAPALSLAAMAAQDPMVRACAIFRDRLNVDALEGAAYDAYFDRICDDLEAAIPTTQAGIAAALALIAEEQAREGEIWSYHTRMLENCIAALGSLT